MTDVYEKLKVDRSEEKPIPTPQTVDDLTKIKGIGSGTAEKLNVRKIYTYRQLAEMAPEKLSEAPGIGVATARKFIEEAKNLLIEFQEQNSEVNNIETFNVVKTVVEEDIEPNETIQQRSATPYEQLLARSENKIEKAIIEPEEIETKTEVDTIETFEVAEVIVEEIEEEPIETNQKPWFSDKFNRSRLTASYPTVSKRSSHESKVEIEEIEESEEIEKIEEIKRYEEEIEKYQETIPEVPEIIETPKKLEINGTVEPFESEETFPEETVFREENFNTELLEDPNVSEVEVPTFAEFIANKVPEISEVIEFQKVPEIIEIAEVPEVREIVEVPARPRVPNHREELATEVAESLKELGYYAIPSGIEALIPFFQNVDYIGLKLVPVKNNSKLILLVPIKLSDLEGTMLIHENKIDYKAYSKAQDSNLTHTVRQHANALLKAKEAMFEDVVNGEHFQEFFEKYLQVRFTVEKIAKNKKLYLVSGQTQYKVLIEPILLTKIPAKCMEKSILYPYQRKTNLHIIDRANIAHLLRFLEKKYKLIESRAKKTNSIETYQNADAKFRSSLRMASLPFLGYSVVLLVIYFSQFYFLLRLFNSIGIAVIGIYVFTMAYFYFKFYKTKKELTTEFETPYYLQNLQFSETDLLCVKEEFTSEQMAQFGYECFGKDKDSKVLEQVDKEKIKESVAAKQMEQETPQLFEFDSDSEDIFIKNEPKHKIKYSSFLED